ncbi:MAG: hypothetical protein E6I87_13370 [Chloroflexi bacterium]|nr:MAG: hypothetical protein E6I87_13370 [Chloroflexota bacterium]
MPKKRRSRARQRTISRPSPVAAPREERVGGAPAPVRPRFTRPGTIARATGQPSQTLTRNATAEYGFVVRDLRRIAITAVGSLVLLGIATVVADFVVFK